MTIKLLIFCVTLVVLISLVQNKLILKQVIILNRHSLRAPLAKNLKDLSPKTWPKWDAKPGFLTAKGARLAGYMGSYIATWLKEEGVLPTFCPNEEDLHVFANSKERTLTSAQSFVEKGFPECKINVQHTGINSPNPLFHPIIHNTSEIFQIHALEEIHDMLKTLHLNKAYELLDQILDYEQSRLCKMDNKCNLATEKNHISIVPGSKPLLSGPLKIGNSVVDAFLMQTYEGFATKDIAWGQLSDLNSWQTVVQLNRAYFNVTYKTRLVAKDLSGPLIKFMSEIFIKDDNTPKVTLLFGHDVNIYTVFETLLLKRYNLDNQIEIIPVGSAVVFQKWEDNECQKNYLKISFLYQSTEQLKDGNFLSLESPPQIKILELETCNIDKDGFCPWDDFKTFLGSL